MDSPKRVDIKDKQETKYCIPIWLRDEQIKHAISCVHARIQRGKEKREEPIAVVCYGPSLNDTWEKIKDFKYVMSCSGAHPFLIKRGIIPDWHVAVDPLPKNTVKLIEKPHRDVEYLIASTCHPDVFEHLKGYCVRLWHVFDNRDDAFRTLPAGEWAITGGANVGLRSMAIAHFFGFTNIHVFGMDGSEGKTGTHAYKHPQKFAGRLVVALDGKDYHTTPAFLECAKQTMHEVDQMPGAKFTFHGEGLVQAMMSKHELKTGKTKSKLGIMKPELISEEYRQLNIELHKNNLSYGVGGSKHVDVVLKLVDSLKSSLDKANISVLDYGSGKGYLAKEFPFPIWEYDPAIPGKEESPKPADLVVCLHRNVKIHTENGLKSIKWIVDNKYSGKVLSLDKNDKFVWRNIINYRGVKNAGTHKKKWVSIKSSTNHSRRRLLCTEDHYCAVIDNIFYPKIRYIKACETLNKFVVRNPKQDKSKHQNENTLYNEDQIAILFGIMMGDGHINKHGQFSIIHSKKQKNYIKLCGEILGGVIKSGPRSGFNGDASLKIEPPRNTQILEMRRLFYVNGVKTIANVLNYLNEKSLAFWYMDDGWLKKYKNSRSVISLCTQGFSERDHNLLCKWFNKKWKVLPRIQKIKNNGKNYNILMFRADDSEKIFSLISKYIPECMQYKLPEKFAGKFNYKFNTNNLEYAASKVCGISYISPDSKRSLSKLYDIEVEETHNFVANDTVVHNCTDVLEHVEPDKLEYVLNDLKRCVKKIGYFTISTRPAKKVLSDGRNAHLIQKDKTWWEKTLNKFFHVGKVINKEEEIIVVLGPKSK